MARHPVARKDGWPSGMETNVNRCISNHAAQKQSRSEVTALHQLPTRGSRHYRPEEPGEKNSGEEGSPTSAMTAAEGWKEPQERGAVVQNVRSHAHKVSPT